MKQHHEKAFARSERATPRKAYEAALADFRPGATWAGLEARQGKPTFVFWGKAAGMETILMIGKMNDMMKVALVLVVNNFLGTVSNFIFVYVKHFLRIKLCQRMSIEPSERNIAVFESLEYQSV